MPGVYPRRRDRQDDKRDRQSEHQHGGTLYVHLSPLALKKAADFSIFLNRPTAPGDTLVVWTPIRRALPDSYWFGSLFLARPARTIPRKMAQRMIQLMPPTPSPHGPTRSAAPPSQPFASASPPAKTTPSDRVCDRSGTLSRLLLQRSVEPNCRWHRVLHRGRCQYGACTDFEVPIVSCLALPGKRPAGDGCAYPSQCQSLLCTGDFKTCGICAGAPAMRVVDGAPCGNVSLNVSCMPGEFCHPQTHVCTSASTIVHATLGEPCDLAADPVVGCEGDLLCVLPTPASILPGSPHRRKVHAASGR